MSPLTTALLAAASVVVALSSPARAESATATQTLTLRVAEVAQIAVSGSPAAALVLTDPGPGRGLPEASDSTTYLRYTSIVAAVNGVPQSRVIQARLAGGRVPAGTRLQLLAATPGGGKVGQVGISAGTITLSGTDQNIITGVRSGWTGTGSTDGARLSYTYSVTEPSALSTAASATLSIVLTLLDPS